MALAKRERTHALVTARAVPPTERWQAGSVGLLLLASIVGMSGCHSPWPFERPVHPIENAQFMEAWETYLHCRSSTEPDEIRSDLHRLKRVAETVMTHDQVSVVLPAAIRSLIAAPPSRLAVDPEAMVIACALHGGHVAQSSGQPELSVELSTAVVTAQKKSGLLLTVPVRPAEGSMTWMRRRDPVAVD